MKKHLIHLILALTLGAAAASAAVELTDLRCEYRVDPWGIDHPAPRLSWKLTDPDHTRGQKQTAYQIVVAESPERLAEGSAPHWDSGRVESSQSVNTRYAGPELGSGRRYHWKVRVWDQSGKVSAWSKPAFFSMGLLRPEDWTGSWIEREDHAVTVHTWFRRNFELTAAPTAGVVHLASSGYHELYVNGRKVTENVMNPVLSYMTTRIPYLTYDITEFLQPGDNVIAVWTGAGWSRWPRTAAYKNAPYAFKAQVAIETRDGRVDLHTDTSWKCAKSNSEYIGNWDILDFGGERVTQANWNPNWNAADFDDRAWGAATVVSESFDPELSAQMVEPQVRYERITPIGIKRRGDAYVVDMGRAYTGFFAMDLRNGAAKQVVTFEISDVEGQASNWKQKSEYVYDKTGTGRFSNRFNIGAGRWITITGLSYEPSLQDIEGFVITNDRRRISHFESSDDLLNWIYKTNVDTYIANTLDGILMDCPHRERRGWGEVTVAALYGDALPNFESGAYMDQYAQYMRDTQLADGQIRAIINENDRPFLMWKANNPLTLWETYRMLGDPRILEESYASLQAWMQWLFKNSNYPHGGLKAGEQGKRAFPGLGDWCTPMGNFWDSSNAPDALHFNNSLYAYMLDSAAQIAATLGHEADAATYRDRLDAQRRAVHAEFFDAATGKYVRGGQIEQIFALIAGVPPADQHKRVYDLMVDTMLYGFPYYDTGSSGQALYTRYLTEYAERMDLVYELLQDTRHPSYGYFRATGATVWPERWSGIGNSRIHTCYTGIGGYFIKGFGGIRPDSEKPGMQHFLIKPAIVGDLRFARTRYESLYGEIVVNWERVGAGADFEIKIPANTTARIHLPASGPAAVTEGGKPAGQVTGLTYLGTEDHAAVGRYVIYQAESGAYRFRTAELPQVEYPAPLYQGDDLARIGRINASSMFIASEKNPDFEAFRVNDDNPATHWTAGNVQGDWIEVEWIAPQTFDRVVIDEVKTAIQRHRIQAWDGARWIDLAQGEGCGPERTHTFAAITATKVRLLIEQATEAPSIRTLRVLRPSPR